MSESHQHIDLTAKIVEWSEKNYGFMAGPIIYLHRASQFTGKMETPPRIGNSTPDVFIKNCDSIGCVIGEAKTTKDLDKPHTKKQLVDYLSYCHTRNSSIFMLAVPWTSVARAKNLIRLTIRKHGLYSAKWVVVDDLGMGFTA